MVYSGRPSTGCGRCRERRKKCDETRPACLNCVKLGRECPGFPDQLDLMFKNETASVERKASRASRPSATKRGSSSKASAGSSNLEQSSDAGPSRQMSTSGDVPPMTMVDDLGIGYMDIQEPSVGMEMSLSSSDKLTRSFLYMLNLRPIQGEITQFDPSTFVREPEAPQSSSPLRLITEAIAIRSVANLPGNKCLILRTNRLYEQSLREVDRAVDSADDEKVEEALNSVPLLALYECAASCSALYWSLHSSTAAIAGTLGSGTTTSSSESQSMQIFRTARSKMFTDNALRQMVYNRVSAAERVSKSQGSKSVDRGLADYPIQMADVLVKATELMLNPQPRTLDAVQQVESLLQEAYDLQNELYRWDMHMPPRLGYRSVVETGKREGTTGGGTLATIDTWPGALHVYESVHVAGLRNHARVSQLLCANVVMEALKWLEPENHADDRRYRAAEYRVQYLVDDIAASVPFHYGYGRAGDGEGGGPRQQDGVIKRDGYFLIWPLYVASQMASISRLQRKWLTGRLDSILQYHGLERSDDHR